MTQSAYNAHYDRTAGSGICWGCVRRPAHVYHYKGERIESLWCERCKLKMGAKKVKAR